MNPSANLTDIHSRYHRAQTLLQASMGANDLVLNATITPHWIEGHDCLWYAKAFYRNDKTVGQTFILVDAVTQSDDNAFDHQALASTLSALVDQTLSADQLPLIDLGITLNPKVLTFTALGKHWEYQNDSQQCREIPYNPNSDRNTSPDGRQEAFTREHNIWLRDLTTGNERPLTTDGERFYAYGEAPTVMGKIGYPLVDLLWSPDGTQVATVLIDTRNVADASPLIEHVPLGETVRPGIRYKGRKLAMLGDEHSEAWQLLTIDVATGAVTMLDHPALPMNYPPYFGFFTARRGWWGQDNQHLYFIDQQADRTHTHVSRWTIKTGQVTVLWAEDPQMRAILADKDKLKVMATPLPASNELLWLSERSGWAHLYLYDLTTGALKNPVTQGEWLVREVLAVDRERREVWIKTAGRVEGHNPYHTDICRVNIDTGELTALTQTDQDDQAFGLQSLSPFYRPRYSLSHSYDYIVTTRSRIDAVPATVLLDRDGKKHLTLEQADISQLPQPWRWPEITKTVAADGVSTIYGMIFRPPNFSEDKSYPVLDFSCVLMSEPVNAFGGGLYLEAAAYAELGFIVVKFFNRGLFGFREKAFHDHKDYTVPFHNLADHVAGTQQLMERYPYMDKHRVGITLHSSYPTALSGLLIHPDFYSVGVAYNPITDARLVPPMNDDYGGNEYPQYEAFASHLRGKLLLIAGMMDHSISVSHTFRMIEALQKANKPFDMLILPNMGHDFPAYAKKRQWDYLVEHLMGEQPPEDFELTFSWLAEV